MIKLDNPTQKDLTLTYAVCELCQNLKSIEYIEQPFYIISILENSFTISNKFNSYKEDYTYGIEITCDDIEKEEFIIDANDYDEEIDLYEKIIDNIRKVFTNAILAF